MTIFVKKRNGKLEEFNAEKINKVIEWACDGLSDVSPSDVAMNAQLSITNKIKTSDIQDILVQSAANMISEDTPNYQYVASRLRIYALRKDVWGESEAPRLLDHLKNNKKHYDDELLSSYSESEIHKINKFIKHDRDYLFAYAGIEQMIDKYLLCNRITGEVYETPQFAFILVPMVLFRNRPNRLDLIKEAYDYISTFKINLPTPILAGVRTKLRFYASCVLADCGDSIDSIFTTAHVVGKYTARRSGIGVNVGRIRAVGSPIRNSEVISTGIIPFLKVIESAVKSTSQNGLRGGGATVSFPWWHYESDDILVLKDNRGTDDNRVRKLDYCIQLDSLFYNRVINNEDVTLFCPNEVKGLYEAFGTPAFKDLYEKYEGDRSIKLKKVVSARSLISLIAKERLETGRIYIMNIDHANSDGPWTQKVNMTNLCCISGDTEVYIKRPDGSSGIVRVDSLVDNYDDFKIISKNIDSDIREYTKILAVKKTRVGSKVLKINVGDTNLVCTPDHLIYTVNRGYVEAQYLNESDKLDLMLGEFYLSSIEYLDEPYDVYDIQVDENNNFYANEILVHNCEIIQPTAPLESTQDPNGEIGICILSAINLLETKDSDLENVCSIIVNMLNELIDYQNYPFEAARKFCQNKRSLGVGVTNFAAWLASHKLNHECPEAIQLTNNLMEKIQFYLLKASNEMAKLNGPAQDFGASLYSTGWLPCDKKVHSDINFDLTMDWESLRSSIKEFGLKNCTLTAIMPAESSSIVQCSTNGMEPIRDILTLKESKTGIKKVLIPKYPKNKQYYVRAFDMKSNENLIKIAGATQRWVDMAISLNTYMNYEHYSGGVIPQSAVIKDIMNAYKYGLKTMYYLNPNDGRQEGIKENNCESGACSI